MKILVTGGAGFIGSHLCDTLISQGHQVVCVDDLSLGREENIKHNSRTPDFLFIKLDINNAEELEKVFSDNRFDCVFHMAANSDIQMGATYLSVDLEKTFMTTFNVLEKMKVHGVKQLVFASSSAIYGELDTVLSEDVGPLFPISFYGAAKLSAEAYISAACENFGIQAWIMRFPNIVGERSTHGAMFDFINRLTENPAELTILGDGTQIKPYLYVADLVDALIYAWSHATDQLNFFNVGVESATDVTTIAEIIVEEMGLKDVSLKYTGGDRGWVGDVPHFRYDLSKIHKLGWKAKRSSDEAMRLAVCAELAKRSVN